MIINEILSDRILEALKDNILTGVYKPGDRLLYKQLAEKFNVSMTPIREALLKLEQEGLVKTIPRKGAYIIELTEHDIDEYTMIRYSLEALAVDTICEKRTALKEIKRLEKINAELKQAIKSRQPILCMSKDIEFHHAIVEICGNKRLYDLVSQLPLTNFSALRGKVEYMIDVGSEIISTHEKIIKGLCNCDAEAAKTELKKNILKPTF